MDEIPPEILSKLPPIPERPNYNLPARMVSTHQPLVDMTPEERDKWHENNGCEMTRKVHEERKKSGYYDLCKKDGCKEIRDKEEHEKRREKDSFNILVQHAREQEQKVKDQAETIDSLTKLLTEQQEKFTDYQLQTEDRFNKLASMMMSIQQQQQAQQSAPPLQPQKSLIRQKSQK